MGVIISRHALVRFAVSRCSPPDKFSPQEYYFNISSLGLLNGNCGKHERLGLIDLLYDTTIFEVSEPRDKVFALVGLARNVDPDFIDYKQSLKEVLTKVATMALMGDSRIVANPLHLLTYVTARTHASDLLSWVPEWKNPGYPFTPLFHILPIKEDIEDLEPNLFVDADEVGRSN